MCAGASSVDPHGKHIKKQFPEWDSWRSLLIGISPLYLRAMMAWGYQKCRTQVSSVSKSVNTFLRKKHLFPCFYSPWTLQTREFPSRSAQSNSLAPFHLRKLCKLSDCVAQVVVLVLHVFYKLPASGTAATARWFLRNRPSLKSACKCATCRAVSCEKFVPLAG